MGSSPCCLSGVAYPPHPPAPETEPSELLLVSSLSSPLYRTRNHIDCPSLSFSLLPPTIMRFTVVVLSLAGAIAGAQVRPHLSFDDLLDVGAAGKNVLKLSTRQSCSSTLDECGDGCLPEGGSYCDDALGEYCEEGDYCTMGGCCENGEVCYGDGGDDDDDDGDGSSILCRRKGRGGGGGSGGGGGGDDDECDAAGIHIPALLIGVAALLPVFI